MRTVLVVGPDFVPSSTPPALRLRFLVRHLREFGWNPVVVSVDPSRYEQVTDPENEKLLLSDLEVIRTPAASPAWTRKFGIGDLGLRSLRQQWKAIRSICARRKIDLLFFSVPPYPTMVLGRFAFQRYRIPYVVDYQDPWVTDYYAGRPKHERPPKWKLFNAIAKRMEPFTLRRAAHLTGVSQGTTDFVARRYPWLNGIGTTEIPLGVEPGDIDYVRRHPRSNQVFSSDDGMVHLSYAGVYIPGMNGALRALFDAVRLGMTEDPQLFGRLRLHFVGTSYALKPAGQVMAAAGEAGVAGLVSERAARVPYLDALQILLESDAVMLLGSDAPHYTASKLFPYILSQKPLLAIFHRESSVVRIAAETRAGTVIPFDNVNDPPAHRVAEIRSWLTALLKTPAELQPKTDWKAFEQYTARAMSQRLAAVFDRTLAAEGALSARAR